MDGEYTYDAANRRIAKTVTGEIERNVEYLWFGDRLVAEYHDGASSPTRRYRYAEREFAPLSYSEEGTHYSVHSDYLNTPKALTNENGITVWKTVLSPYGQPTESRDVDGDGREVAFNMRFPGQYHDRETGLYYNRNRTYDPTTGRYLQSDPIGLDGGDANLYRYAASNPVSYYDPYGLFLCSLLEGMSGNLNLGVAGGYGIAGGVNVGLSSEGVSLGGNVGVGGGGSITATYGDSIKLAEGGDGINDSGVHVNTSVSVSGGTGTVGAKGSLKVGTEGGSVSGEGGYGIGGAVVSGIEVKGSVLDCSSEDDDC